MPREDMEKIVAARIRDAEVMFENERYDSSVYLCGYAAELGLKVIICRTLKWEEYPTSGKYTTFKSHDLDVLLHLTGLEEEIAVGLFESWSIVSQWRPEIRYSQ